MEDYTTAVGEIKKLYSKGIRFGTEVTRRMLDGLGSPDKKLKIIHVAGTNGKGSVAEFMTRILIADGKRVGTFTSPEVYDYRDMFRVNGENLSKGALCGYFDDVIPTSKSNDATGFETETCAALYAFAGEECEYAVIECGMGGRNDATNAVKEKELALITSVSLEHTAYLGDTLEKICAHKAGIIKNCPAVVSALQPYVCRKYFGELGVKFADGVSPCGDGFMYGGERFKLSVQGSCQPYNAAVAIEGARLLNIGENAIHEGISEARPQGRLQEFVIGGRTYILDGAHNPAAFAPLGDALRKFGRNGRITVIFGCLSDKDIEGNLKEIEGCADGIICVKCDSPRATDLYATEAACRKYFARVDGAGSVAEALDAAEGETVAVCGSFTLLSEAKKWIDKKLKRL